LKTAVLLNEVWNLQHNVFFSVAEVMPVHWHFCSPILASKKRLPLETHQSIVLLRDEGYSICECTIPSWIKTAYWI